MSATKTTDNWPLQVSLSVESIEVNGWDTERWQIDAIEPHQDDKPDFFHLDLDLHKDERTAYRFNLDSQQPHLFVLCNEDEMDNTLTPIHITASQDDAASFMDGEHKMLEVAMPQAVQCWIDTYLGIHGELIDCGKKKKKGKGRSSER